MLLILLFQKPRLPLFFCLELQVYFILNLSRFLPFCVDAHPIIKIVPRRSLEILRISVANEVGSILINQAAPSLVWSAGYWKVKQVSLGPLDIIFMSLRGQRSRWGAGCCSLPFLDFQEQLHKHWLELKPVGERTGASDTPFPLYVTPAGGEHNDG